MGDGDGDCADGVQGGATGIGFHVAGGGSDSQGGGVLLMHWHRGGDVEGSGGDFKPPACSLHHLPRLPPHILGGLRHRYCHP